MLTRVSKKSFSFFKKIPQKSFCTTKSLNKIQEFYQELLEIQKCAAKVSQGTLLEPNQRQKN